MNAAEYFAQRLPGDSVRRLAARRVIRFDALDEDGAARPGATRGVTVDEARAIVAARWRGDLCGLLNALTRGDLETLCERSGARSPELRLAAWELGAALERGGTDVPPVLQPRPVLLGGHLVVQAPPRGMYPRAASYPRPLPTPVPAAPPADEPETLDELLAAADRAIGVQLGARGRDKGAWGMRAAALLGVPERGHEEPDWRGDVEVKTVPVAQEASGLWRVVEDPAIAMVGERHLAKLQRTLWLARAPVGDGEDATIVSWYLLEWDAHVARMARRFLHVRPKGPANTDQRGIYLSKRFFAEAGMLATLNGPCL
ncbi:MAG: hypothetical protein JO257_04725 [Deltaproteobacteria bacterium]|nr:hypothetical protein [Deltaproteobacteria bacterium]